ncbi:hypothetical protein [Plantactinospora endophytica]|uniref:Phage holin family protein n=1 Tax=Plantactinospora endophytica TaxID=673535 RepID=A0ABQ4E4S2_9ACTN|nr:hypothetical protein [Plantactinospora endophytica]GIG89695.1 hypothetical protein Pen02_46310 [Plantactinospora endophytica]
MTEEAQPPGVERAADGTPGQQPAGQESRHHEPSYTLPPDATVSSTAPNPVTPSPATSSPSPVTPVASGPSPSGSPVPAISAWGPVPAAGSTPPVTAYPVAEPLRVAVPSGAPAGYPGTAGPHGGPSGAGGAGPAAVPAPPRESLRSPSRVDTVPGTPFGLVYLDVAPVTSGPAVASLVTGIGSVLVALAGGCLGLVGVSGGWGGWVAGAFAVLAGLLGVAGVLLGELGRRQTSPAGTAAWPWRRRAAGGAASAGTAPPVRFTGRGLAISGLVCAGVGLALTVLAVAVAVLLQLA